MSLGFRKWDAAFAASSLAVSKVGTDQLARIVELEPFAAMVNILRGGLAASDPDVLMMTRSLGRSGPGLMEPGVVEMRVLPSADRQRGRADS